MNCWLDGQVHAFEFFGSVSALVVPGNEKTGITKAHRYVPT